MPTWIKINNRYINIDQIAYVRTFSDGTIIVSFNDDGNHDNAHTLEFAKDESLALKDYLDRSASDLIKDRDDGIERQRRADCVKNHICPDCGQPLMVGGAFDGECTSCGFNKWA